MLLQSGVVQLRGAISNCALSPIHSPTPDDYREVCLSSVSELRATLSDPENVAFRVFLGKRVA